MKSDNKYISKETHQKWVCGECVEHLGATESDCIMFVRNDTITIPSKCPFDIYVPLWEMEE